MEGAGADVLEKGVGVVPAGGAIAAARPSATVLEPGGAGTGGGSGRQLVGGRNVKGRSAANPRQQTVFLLGFGRNVCTTSYN
jgi:hypothetical protein